MKKEFKEKFIRMEAAAIRIEKREEEKERKNLKKRKVGGFDEL